MFPALPLRLVDLVGALLAIGLSLGCLRLSFRLNRADRNHLVWTYLHWVCVCLVAFAVSRSAGHIVRQGLRMAGRDELWAQIQPFSGGVNTFTLVVLAAITLFFERVWRVYRELDRERSALDRAHADLLRAHETLEERVRERSEALARSEKQMALADRLAAIGELSSGVAHELNNPLGVILGYTQLLMRDEPPGSQRAEDLKTIEKHVRNCKAVVEDLLNFAGGGCVSDGPFDLHDMLEGVLGLVRHRRGGDGLKIVTEYGRDIPEIRLDEKKIKQVMLNLLLNARDAAGAEGTVHLSTGYDPGTERVIVRVRDDGYGIEPQHLSRIFDPFFTTKPTGEGTGLGLAVSYGIVKHNGGDIQVESRPGAGAEFTVILPAGSGEGHGGNAAHSGG